MFWPCCRPLFVEPCDLDRFILEPRLDWLAPHVAADFISRQIDAADRNKLGLEVDDRKCAPAFRHRRPPSRAREGFVDMDGAAGEDFSARGDRADDGHIAVGMVHGLTRNAPVRPG